MKWKEFFFVGSSSGRAMLISYLRDKLILKQCVDEELELAREAFGMKNASIGFYPKNKKK